MVELAARDSYGSVTVRKLTKLAGVSTGAFYAHFECTDDCLLDAYGTIMDEADRRAAATRSSGLDTPQQLDRTLRALLDVLGADSSIARFALIEVYAGGPAALAEVASQEARLGATLRECLDRRRHRVSEPVVASVLAATLHYVRARLLGIFPEDSPETADELIEWACAYVQAGGPSAPPDFDGSARRIGPSLAELTAKSATGDDTDLILAAILRLASLNGYFSLAPNRVCAAAGLPATRFRRHFSSLADGYLAALRRTCGSFFVELTSSPYIEPRCGQSLPAALQRARHRALADPAAARLTFSRVVEAGVPGLTCREALIHELATAWRAATPVGERPSPVSADAAAAAFWTTLSP